MLVGVSDCMRRKSITTSRVLVPTFALLLAACAQAPMAPSETHIRAEPVARDEGSIPPPARQDAGGTQEKQTYTIRPGDTLGKIAKKFLGDSRKYMLIATLNDIKDPNIIQAGAELIIMSGAYTGFDINYSVIAHDTDGAVFTSKSRFVSVS